MNTYGLTKGNIFPITENGIKEFYITDAPINIITRAFNISNHIDGFIESIEERGYKINKYRSGIVINFDEK